MSVRIPSVNLKATPKVKVAVGATRGMRKARRGHAFFLRVRAVGDRLSGVKVIVRNRRGRRVGSTKSFTLATKSRRVRVKVNRRITAGRYRFSAAGTSPEGIAVKGTKRVRVRKARATPLTCGWRWPPTSGPAWPTRWWSSCASAATSPCCTAR